jgi:hypothetical protein
LRDFLSRHTSRIICGGSSDHDRDAVRSANRFAVNSLRWIVALGTK